MASKVAARQPNPASGPILSVASATRRLDGRQVLAGVDLDAGAGELVALLGPNGAGKTTLLRAISGRLRLDAGAVRVCGADPAAAETRQLIGLVPQSIALYGKLSARANLELFGRLMGVPARALGDAVTEALEWTGLSERAAEPVSRLSGGMQRRLHIAASTLHRPRLLLLDEPTVGLDPAVRTGIHDVLRALRRADMAIVLTTHDLQEAAELADRVAFMAAGRVLAAGSPAGLVREHYGESRELNLFLVAPPVERARGVLVSLGLLPTSQPRLWVGQLSDELESLQRLRAELDGHGLAVDEIRVREPGLHGVFLRLTGLLPERDT